LLQNKIIADVQDLLSFPLLHDIQRADWSSWLDEYGVDEKDATHGAALDGSLLIDAAVAGHGVALVEDIYAEPELRSGRLVKAIDLPVSTMFAYYLVARPASLRKNGVRSFASWIETCVNAPPLAAAGEPEQRSPPEGAAAHHSPSAFAATAADLNRALLDGTFTKPLCK
jgi:DNA-binding transcriptional LysR family regulator